MIKQETKNITERELAGAHVFAWRTYPDLQKPSGEPAGAYSQLRARALSGIDSRKLK